MLDNNEPIGIIGAMEEEIESILDLITEKKEKIIGSRVYNEGYINNTKVILVFSRWGKVASSSTATTLINVFGVKSIIFSGIAGSMNKNIAIGDIVLATHLFQHDMDARPIFSKYEIPLLGKTTFETSKALNEKLAFSIKNFIDNVSKNMTLKNHLLDLNIETPIQHSGSIASGDRFVNNTDLVDSIKNYDIECCAVEMEGASVAQVCFEHNIPFAVVRYISDFANSDAHIDFSKFINNIVKIYSKGIIKGFFYG